MPNHTCRMCERTRIATDRYACASCRHLADGALATIATLTPHLDSLRAGEAAHRYDRSRITGSAAHGTNLDPRISNTRDATLKTLRETAQTCAHRAPAHIGTEWAPDSHSIPQIARWLTQFTQWLTTQHDGPAHLTKITQQAHRIENLWPTTSEYRPLGKCGHNNCDGQLRAKQAAHAGTITCKTCGTKHDIAQRINHNTQKIMQTQATIKELTKYYTGRATERDIRRLIEQHKLTTSGTRTVTTSKGTRQAATYQLKDAEQAIQQLEKQRHQQRINRATRRHKNTT